MLLRNGPDLGSDSRIVKGPRFTSRTNPQIVTCPLNSMGYDTITFCFRAETTGSKTEI